MADWGEIFAFTAPPGETIARGTVMFLALFAMMRLVGKREGGAHSLTDLLYPFRPTSMRLSRRRSAGVRPQASVEARTFRT